jgi:hypothetical protein
MHPITLTAAQVEAVDWALDGMFDYWDECADENDPRGLIPRPVLLPRLIGKSLHIANVHGSVIDDLMQRICLQLDDVAEDEGRTNRAGWNAWEKIKKALSPEQLHQLTN